MIETWLDQAKPGWPYVCAYVLAWIAYLLLMPLVMLLNLGYHGLSDWRWVLRLTCS